MHPKNPYSDRYDIKGLAKHYPSLKEHIILNPDGQQTIDFSSSLSVFELNKAILLKDFDLEEYQLPTGYLIPPIPGRLDYLLHLKEFLIEKFKIKKDSEIKGLDIGSGANGIYCILAAQYFNWNMVGAESDARAVEIANNNINGNKRLKDRVEIRLQKDKSFLFKNIIQPDEQFDFSICNPPFHSSKEEALKGSFKKIRNLGGTATDQDISLNFEGQANELWCNGGESLFIKRMIKESVSYKSQVKVFSSLVSKSENLPKIEKQLRKIKSQHQIIPMEQGNKKSRIVLWWFN
ncbi:23S rRNA (adenine1618-N6)-methyltransferase [Flavobacteriaceae bacterium MAR_2010_188]|nr:23S rRNA (adenine1618-N6)-methyltransferase [Flavobacteriaceae bacterium MAR_2010_188]